MANLGRSPEWQQNCRSVSFLTTMHQGHGTRWRVTDAGGQDRVYQITAWYDRLGYEYLIVDGAGFKQNRGQIRLQEIVEGTVVQWTFSYELGGFMGGVRNVLGIRRQIDSAIQESLRSLYRLITKGGEAVIESKAQMRDAPDAVSRAQYRPRHKSAFDQKQAPPLTLTEPPLAEGDTRPHSVVTEIGAPDPGITAPADDALFRPPTPTTAPAATSEVMPPVLPTPAPGLAPEPFRLPSFDQENVVETEKLPTVITDDLDNTATPVKTDARDTSHLSVFELFGLPKPSETQELQKVISPASSAAATEVRAPVSTPELPSRFGLRYKQRRGAVRLRRP